VANVLAVYENLKINVGFAVLVCTPTIVRYVEKDAVRH